MGKIAKSLYGPILGLFVDGKKGLLRGLGNAVTAYVGGPLAVGLSLGSSLLSPKMKGPPTSASSADRLFVSIDPRTPRMIVFGRTAMATDIRDQEYTGEQEYLHRFIVVASHRVQAIEEIWFDDKRVWTVGGGVEGDVAGYLTVTPILEGSAANAINISSRMGTSRRYTGCAYVHLTFKLTGNSKKSESPFAQSIPTRVTIRGKGAFLYDPRLDSTVGGSGPQRANNQSTWAWSDSACRNPALQELWYELGWRINGKLAVGKGVPPERLDIASYITAANICDESVALASGGSEPRYRSDGVFSEGDQPSLVRDNLKAAMNAVLDDMDGKIRLTVVSNDLGSPIADFTDADIIDGVRWDQTPSLVDTFNVIRGSYTDPSDQSLYQMVDYPEIALPSVDGIERIETIDFPLVQSPSQAQRLAKQRLQRMQYPGVFTANFQATAWRVQKGDVVRLTFPALGWLNKLFRVIDITVRVDGVVPMVLREEHASIYAWSASEAPAVTGAAPTTYDWTKNPLYADIVDLSAQISGDAIVAHLTNENHVLPADADGNVLSYSGASTGFVIYSAGEDVSANFTLSVTSNPQALTVNIASHTATVTAGLDVGEPNATVLLRMTGSGDFAGIIMERQFNLVKSRAGADGSPAPIISLTADKAFAKYNAADIYVGGAIKFTAIRQNIPGTTTSFKIIKVSDGFIINDATADAYGAFPEYAGSAGDVLNFTADYVSALIGTYGTVRVVAYRDGYPIIDSVTIAKVKDGANGTNGLDGTNGLPGAPGADGQTSYVHFAYANSADGSVDFTTGAAGGRFYVGVYTDFTAADSSSPGAYTWSLQRGADGANGTPGAPGSNGQPSYVHIAYANSPDGSTDFHLSDPTGRRYIGVYTDSTIADSSSPGAYTWSLIKGADGANGAPGSDGVSPISVSALPEGLQISLNADGSPAGGSLPQAIGVSVTKAGVASAITSITIVSNPGNSANVSGNQINVTAVSGDGEVVFDVVSAGQTVRKRVSITTTRAGSNGALQQVLAINTPQLTWTAYAQHGGSIAINASAAGKLKLNLTGNMRAPNTGDDLRFQSKLQYRDSGGTWTDVSGSEAISTRSETVFDPTRVIPANVNGAGPYTLTGLTVSGAYEVRALTRKYDGSATTSASVNLNMSAEQVA